MTFNLRLLSTFAIGFALLFAPTQTIAQGSSMHTQGSQWVDDPSWGFRLPLPQGWRIKKNPSGAVIGHNTIPGLILVFSHSLGSVAKVTAEMSKGINEQGNQLRLVSKLVPFGKQCLAGNYTGTLSGQPGRARALGTLFPSGSGAIIIAASTNQVWSGALMKAAEAIANNMVAARPQSQQSGPASHASWITCGYS